MYIALMVNHCYVQAKLHYSVMAYHHTNTIWVAISSQTAYKVIGYPYSKLFVGFVFNVPPTAKVIWRRGHGFKSHPTDW